MLVVYVTGGSFYSQIWCIILLGLFLIPFETIKKHFENGYSIYVFQIIPSSGLLYRCDRSLTFLCCEMLMTPYLFIGFHPNTKFQLDTCMHFGRIRKCRIRRKIKTFKWNFGHSRVNFLQIWYVDSPTYFVSNHASLKYSVIVRVITDNMVA